MSRQDEAAVAVDAANARVKAAANRAETAVAEAHADAKAAVNRAEVANAKAARVDVGQAQAK